MSGSITNDPVAHEGTLRENMAIDFSFQGPLLDDTSSENDSLPDTTTANDLVTHEGMLRENLAVSFEDIFKNALKRALAHDSTKDDTVSKRNLELAKAMINHQTTDEVMDDAFTDHRTIDTALLSEVSKDEALCRSRADTESTSESMELESDIAIDKAFSIPLESDGLERIVQLQKEAARKGMALPLWPKGLRLCQDAVGTQHVVENDPVNPCLGKGEYDFLIHLLKAPGAHYVWAEAANNIESTHSANKPPLIWEVIEILTTCLEINLKDLEQVQSLRDTSTWVGSHSLLHTWLPQTICRLFGHKIEDGDDGYLNMLEIIGGNVFKITNSVIGTQHMILAEKEDLSDIQQVVNPLIHMTIFIWRQHLPIRNEIEYFGKKADATHSRS